MQQSPAKRLEWILKEKELGGAELERLTDWSRTQIWRYLEGKSPISEKFSRALKSALGVNPKWLMTGSGEPWVAKVILKRPDETERYEAAALREEGPPNEVEIWKRRTLVAERKLAALRSQLRDLLDVSADVPQERKNAPAVNSKPSGEDEGLLDAAEEPDQPAP